MEKLVVCKACNSLCIDSWASPIMIFSDGKTSPNTPLYKCPSCGSYNKYLDRNWKESCSKNYSSNYEASPYTGLPQGSHLKRIKDTTANIFHVIQDKDIQILDYGMGQGDFSKYILHHFPNLKVYGYDLFPQKLEDSLLSNQNFCVINSYNDIRKASYDVISLIQAFEHLENPITTLNDLAKCLKSGGQILLQFPTATFNPIDLIVFDHTCHYTYSYEMLKGLQSQLNFQSEIRCNISNEKEMLISIKPTSSPNNIHLQTSASIQESTFQNPSLILDSFINKITYIFKNQPFYILGITYKSIWICEVLQCSHSHMIEINPSNHNQFNKSKVLILPFPESIANKIASQFGFDNYVSLS